MKKRVASIVLVSAMGVGTVSSLALTPAIAATASHASQRLTDIKDALKGLVSDGTITQGQADKVATALDQALPRRVRHGLLEDAAAVLKLTPAQIRTAMGTTKSLADVAAAQGISKADLIAKLVAAIDTHLAAQVKAGRITQAQADTRRSEAKTRVTEAVDRVGLPPRHEGGPGRGPGHDGGPGQDGPPPAGTGPASSTT